MLLQIPTRIRVEKVYVARVLEKLDYILKKKFSSTTKKCWCVMHTLDIALVEQDIATQELSTTQIDMSEKKKKNRKK